MEYDDLFNFDWFNFTSTAKTFKPEFISIMSIDQESPYERKQRMLKQLSTTCLSCSMCSLGLSPASNDNEIRDPHVFSNVNPTRFMIIGKSPSWEDVKRQQPLVGDAGRIFGEEVKKNGLSRGDFYICNTVRCYSSDELSIKNKKSCEPFLQMELNLIKPLLVITLGQDAFAQFCPDFSYVCSSIAKSNRYKTSVFAMDIPSLSDEFKKQMNKMCKLVLAIKSKYKL